MSYYSNYGYESSDGGWGKIIAIIIFLFFVAWGDGQLQCEYGSTEQPHGYDNRHRRGLCVRRKY